MIKIGEIYLYRARIEPPTSISKAYTLSIKTFSAFYSEHDEAYVVRGKAINYTVDLGEYSTPYEELWTNDFNKARNWISKKRLERIEYHKKQIAMLQNANKIDYQ